MKSALMCVLGAGVAAVLSGCGGSSLPEGETYGTVSGTIKFNGEPVAEGTQVVFKNEQAGWMATGTVKGGGAFSLRFRDGTDIPTGIYTIGVTPKVEGTGPKVDGEGDEYANMMGVDPNTGAAKPAADAGAEAPPFPARYASPDSSAEEFTVKEGDNEYTLDMKEA